MSFLSNLQSFINEVGADYKTFRTWMFGSATGDLNGLTTDDKSSFVSAINEVKAAATGAPPNATESQRGVIEIADSSETASGTNDTNAITPKKLLDKLTSFAQPLSTNLSALSNIVSGTLGRQLLETSSASQAHTLLGLSAVAVSGSAADLTGQLPASALPPLAINDTFTVASQAEMLALTAQRGDVAIRTDNSRSYILAVEGASTLANWKQLTNGGDVSSVAGRTGAVTLTKSDVGLANVDNTSDMSKPVSTAQGAAIDAKMSKSQNLNDVADKPTARNNLDVYSKSAIGDPETDLVAVYNTAKA